MVSVCCCHHEGRGAAVISTVGVSTRSQQGPAGFNTAGRCCSMQCCLALGPTGGIDIHTIAWLAELLQLR